MIYNLKEWDLEEDSEWLVCSECFEEVHLSQVTFKENKRLCRACIKGDEYEKG